MKELKKEYYTPVIVVSTIEVKTVITMGTTVEKGEDDEYVGEDDALSNEHFGSWDDIWHAM